MVFLQDEFLRKCHKYFAPVTNLLPLSSKATSHCLLCGNEAGLSPPPVGMMLSFASRASRELWRTKFSLPSFLVLLSLGSGSSLDRQHGAPSYPQFPMVTSSVASQQSTGSKAFPQKQFSPVHQGLISNKFYQCGTSSNFDI